MKIYIIITLVMASYLIFLAFCSSLVASLSPGVVEVVEKLQKEDDETAPKATMSPLKRHKKKHRLLHKHRGNGSMSLNGYNNKNVSHLQRQHISNKHSKKEKNVASEQKVNSREMVVDKPELKFYYRGKRMLELDDSFLQEDDNQIIPINSFPIEKQNDAEKDKDISTSLPEKKDFVNEEVPEVENQTEKTITLKMPDVGNQREKTATLEVRIRYKTPTRVYLDLVNDDEHTTGRSPYPVPATTTETVATTQQAMPGTQTTATTHVPENSSENPPPPLEGVLNLIGEEVDDSDDESNNVNQSTVATATTSTTTSTTEEDITTTTTEDITTTTTEEDITTTTTEEDITTTTTEEDITTTTTEEDITTTTTEEDITTTTTEEDITTTTTEEDITTTTTTTQEPQSAEKPTAILEDTTEYKKEPEPEIPDKADDDIGDITWTPPPETSERTTESEVTPGEVKTLPSSHIDDRFGTGRKDIKLLQEGTEFRPEVKTKSAIFHGLTMNLESGKRVFTFYGISYAAPPVGKLRFKRPFPAKLSPSRDGVFEATRLNPPCFPSRMERTSASAASKLTLNKEQSGEKVGGQQTNDSKYNTTNVSEDCLYINIWVPGIVVVDDQQPVNSTLYPILVWIHGEGFLNGMDHEDYKSAAEFVAKTNVIVVAFQYRLGAFGFGNWNSIEYSENAGLHDQIQALEWIEENIESFGGDPNAITLMGHDVGAAFVGYHLISKISLGYFSRAVMIGGSPLQPHLFHSKHVSNRMSMELATKLGCVNSKSRKTIMACLQNMDPVSIWKVQVEMQQRGDNPFTVTFAPTDDGTIIPGNPTKLLANGRGKICEVLVGGSSNEGSTVLEDILERLLSHSPTPAFISYDKFLSVMNHIFSEQFSELEMDTILHEYKNWVNLTDGYANQISVADAVGDFYFTCPLRQFADLWSARGLPTYYFTFSLRSSAKKRAEWMGAVHGDELDYFFGVPLRFPSAFSEAEVKLSGKLMNVLENFIYAGDPHEDWERYGKETPQFAEFNEKGSIYGTDTEPRYGHRREQCAFWNELLPKITAALASAAGNSATVTEGAETLSSYQYSPIDRESRSAAEGASLIYDTSSSDSFIKSQSFNVDENCYVALHNCSTSNFAIYVN